MNILERCKTVLEFHLSGAMDEVSEWDFYQLTGSRIESARLWRDKFVKTGAVPSIYGDTLLTVEELLHNEEMEQVYSLLLGIYLGDGSVCKSHRRCAEFCVAGDWRQDRALQVAELATKTIFELNKVSVSRKAGEHSAFIRVSSNNALTLFPQSIGGGQKWSKHIVLTDWQERCVRKNPKGFVQGLFLTDGSRSLHGRYKQQPLWTFFNKSPDIINLTRWGLNLVGVEFNDPRYSVGGFSFSVKAKSTAALDKIVGSKYTQRSKFKLPAYDLIKHPAYCAATSTVAR